MSNIAKIHAEAVNIRDAGGDLVDFFASKVNACDLREVYKFDRYQSGVDIMHWSKRGSVDKTIESAIAKVIYG